MNETEIFIFYLAFISTSDGVKNIKKIIIYYHLVFDMIMIQKLQIELFILSSEKKLRKK